MHTTQPYLLPTAVPKARSATRRVICGWAADMLALGRRGLLTPNWAALQRATQHAGLARPPRADAANSFRTED